MKLLKIKGEFKEFSSYKEMFKFLAGDNYTIISIEKGLINIENGKEKLAVIFGELNFKDSIIDEKFNEEIIEYREDQRTSMANLMELGINIDKKETEKLSKMFKFLNK